MHPHLVKTARHAVQVHAVRKDDLKAFLKSLDERQAATLKSTGFVARDGQLALLTDEAGKLAAAVLGLGKNSDTLALAAFAEQLPGGTYALGTVPEAMAGENAALAWLLGTYEFTRYRKSEAREAKLILPQDADGEEVTRIAEAIFRARDLINTPANDMGPEELASAARAVAEKHGAAFEVVMGEDLLAQNYPLIHAVGKGSDRAPRIASFSWGRDGAPKVTLVGKGVCFDTGGYDLKPPAGMLSMKKDMGGAATVLAIADMVLGARLDVRLRVLIPAVENSVSGRAYRPGDVFPSRKGLTVEIGNTDAEGRLVLADALTEADAEAPELLIDIATLTGAARTATGFELPPFFTDDEALAAELTAEAVRVNDPVWRLPLWRGYESALSSSVADLTNNPNYGHAGAITAALFLNRFVEKAKSWAHFDIAASVDRPKPGRRTGGEANAARAIYAVLKARYGRSRHRSREAAEIG